MKNILPIISFCLILSACSTTISVPVSEPTVIPGKSSLVFVYYGMGVYEPQKIKIFMDKQCIGEVGSTFPLTVTVAPGQHELHTRMKGPVIDRITTAYFEPNQIYYLSVWFEGGVWVGSNRITPISKLTSYEILKYPFQ